jgi:hypothetical protein
MILVEALYIVIVSIIAVAMAIVAGQLTEWVLTRKRTKHNSHTNLDVDKTSGSNSSFQTVVASNLEFAPGRPHAPPRRSFLFADRKSTSSYTPIRDPALPR